MGIRGKPNERRQAIIDKAFLKFDYNGSNLADVRDLKAVFNASKHPLVIAGEITEDMAFAQFLKNFNDSTGDGRVDRFVGF